MSRIGKVPIVIPNGVEVTIDSNNMVTVKGPKGTLKKSLSKEMAIEKENNEIIISRPSDLKKHKALHGLTRTLLSNMVIGVTTGFEKVLEINGVGYRAQKQGTKIILNIGYSHPVEIDEIEGITVEVPAPNKMIVKGIDKQVVGQFAAMIRFKRKPEVYKGKGIKYDTEVIRRKEGKTGAKGKK